MDVVKQARGDDLSIGFVGRGSRLLMVKTSNRTPTVGTVNICKQVALFIVHASLKRFSPPSSGVPKKNSKRPKDILGRPEQQLGFWYADVVENLEIRHDRPPIKITRKRASFCKSKQFL
ncbi:hypothetical protein [Rhodobacter capsulatus]|uniref:hypothetical protein n=1 Tax=Rhodobacter capsulatus TaxID=1061 RepID=UPI0013791AE7|nr:hypothetical protein [Rhodobacter capsulatus]